MRDHWLVPGTHLTMTVCYRLAKPSECNTGCLEDIKMLDLLRKLDPRGWDPFSRWVALGAVAAVLVVACLVEC